MEQQAKQRRVELRVVMSPKGHFISLTARLATYVRHGQMRGFREYIRSPEYLEHFAGLDPDQRLNLARIIVQGEAVCQRRSREPRAAKPKPITAPASSKLVWQNNLPLLAKLANAYAKAGPENHRGAAALMGISPGQARQAKRTYLDAAATMPAQKAA